MKNSVSDISGSMTPSILNLSPAGKLFPSTPSLPYPLQPTPSQPLKGHPSAKRYHVVHTSIVISLLLSIDRFIQGFCSLSHGTEGVTIWNWCCIAVTSQADAHSKYCTANSWHHSTTYQVMEWTLVVFVLHMLVYIVCCMCRLVQYTG